MLILRIELEIVSCSFGKDWLSYPFSTIDNDDGLFSFFSLSINGIRNRRNAENIATPPIKKYPTA